MNFRVIARFLGARGLGNNEKPERFKKKKGKRGLIKGKEWGEKRRWE